MRRSLLSVCALTLPVLLLGSLRAQDVFVVPGGSGNITPTVFSANPFNQVAILSAAGFDTSFVFAGPGGKFYLVSNTSNGTIQVTDGTFANLKTAGNVVGVLEAFITPDLKHIFEISAGGALNIIDTSTDTFSATSQNESGQIIDLASSLDSSRGYALSFTSSGYFFAAFNPSTGNEISSIPLGALTATGIAVAPNGLIYVSQQNAVLELDPNNYSVRRTITVVGRPGKLTFTPDGKTGLAPNLTPVSGTAIYEFDMPSRTLRNSVAQSSFTSGITIDRVIPVGNNRALAYSSTSQVLYDIALDTLNVQPFAFANSGGVTSVAVSQNLPAGANLNTSYVFFTANGTIYRADLNAAQVTGQLNLSGTPGAMFFAAPPDTTDTPAALLTFGDGQSIAPNVSSAPMVLKVIDANGDPLSGVQVSLSTTAPGAVLSASTLFTDSQGNVVFTASSPTTQTVPIAAAVTGGLATAFSLNVGSTGGGGGGGGNPNAGLIIIGGQGNIITEQQRTDAADGTSMVVQLNDANGNPLQGQQIVFTLQSGSGTVIDNQGGNIGIGQSLNETTTTCTSSSPKGCLPGQASVDFLSSVVPTVPPTYSQASITATAPDGTTVTFYITTVPFNVVYQAQIEIHQPVRGTTIVAQQGQVVKSAVQAVVSSGTAAPIANVGLFLQNVDPTQPSPATCVSGTVLSDANGSISCDLVATALPGTYQFNVVVGGTRTIGPYAVRILPGSPTTVTAISGDQQSGNPGGTLNSPLTIQVTDAAGNPSANVSVTWTVTPSNGATLSNVSNTTDANGKASATVTFSNTASGTVQVTATAGNLAPKVFTLTATLPIAGIQLVSGGGQSVALNTQFASPVIVKVTDSSGKGVAGIPISFGASNGGTVSAQQVVSDVNGQAQVNVTAGGTAGTIVVTAAAGSFNVTASLTAVPPGPANMVFLNGASFLKAISAGAIVAIQGTGLVTSQGIFSAQGLVGQLPTTFMGVTVTFNGIQAPIFSISNVNGVQQVVVQLPYEIGAVNSVTAVVTGQGGGSTTVSNLPVQPYAPGIFETVVNGQKQAVAVRSDGSYVSPSNPARRGENVTIYLTGMGQTNPATGTNRAGIAGQTVIAPVVAGINLAGVPVVSSATAPALIGVYTVTLTIPANAATGSAINVGVIEYDSANNPYFAQGSSIPIQ